MHFGFMNVILFTVTCRMLRPFMWPSLWWQVLCDSSCGMTPTHYALTTLKMTTRVAETSRWSLY